MFKIQLFDSDQLILAAADPDFFSVREGGFPVGFGHTVVEMVVTVVEPSGRTKVGEAASGDRLGAGRGIGDRFRRCDQKYRDGLRQPGREDGAAQERQADGKTGQLVALEMVQAQKDIRIHDRAADLRLFYIDFDGKLTAIKINFGEPGNLAYLRPNYAKAVADLVKELGGVPFLTDCNTLYVGRRKNALEHLEAAYENGFSPFSTGCHVLIADGLKGTDDVSVPVEGAPRQYRLGVLGHLNAEVIVGAVVVVGDRVARATS